MEKSRPKQTENLRRQQQSERDKSHRHIRDLVLLVLTVALAVVSTRSNDPLVVYPFLLTSLIGLVVLCAVYEGPRAWRILAGILGAAMFVWVGVRAWPPPDSIEGHANIAVAEIRPVYKESQVRGTLPPPFVNFYFHDIGQLAADQIVDQVILLPRPNEMDKTSITDEQDKILRLDDWKAWMESRTGQEMQPGDSGRFISVPSDPSDYRAEVLKSYLKWTLPTKLLYVLITLKYIDRKLPSDRHIVTERCSFFIGDSTTDHGCGRNRVFIESNDK